MVAKAKSSPEMKPLGFFKHVKITWIALWMLFFSLMSSWLFRWWDEYFNFDVDVRATLLAPPGERRIYFEFHHGVFPMGQVLSCHRIQDIFLVRSFTDLLLLALVIRVTSFHFEILRSF